MAKKKENIKGKTNRNITVKKNKTIKRRNTVTKETKEPTDPKTLEILMALGVLFLIISYFTMGLITTIILVVGIALIIGISYLMKKMNKNSKKRKVLNTLAIIFLSFCIVGSLAASGLLLYVVFTAPDFDPNELNNKESTIIYDASGNEIVRLGTELRENITYDELPQVFIDALIATEDSRFFQHNGFDAPRFLSASIKQLLGNRNAGGASTLSMQVVKNTYTDATLDSGLKGIIRKFTDIYLAVFKLEKNYTKQQIIEFYVNNHSLGGTVFGVQEAANTYFNKDIRDLTLAEASILAGMFQAPTTYNPVKNPENAEKRRAEVLYLMVRHGYISQAEADAANAIPVESLVASGGSSIDSEYQDYIDTVLDELNTKYNIYFTQTPVLIYTNMDAEKQKQITDIFNGTSSAFTWQNDTVQAGVGVVENATGKLIAVGAGRNRVGERSLNYAETKQQIGSTAKPIFDYGPGIEYNNWSTYEQFNDEPWSYTNGPSINNSDMKFMGWMSLRTALSLSRNIPALKAFQSLDRNKIIEFATNLGIEPEIENGYLHEAHALGSFSGATPIQMAAAYAAFANGGTYNEPYTINRIVYRETGEEVPIEVENHRAMSDATAFMITDVLKTSVQSGLASGVRMNGVNLAAKTGTTNFPQEALDQYNIPWGSVKDAWVVGYDPQYSIGMWYGYEDITKGYNTSAQATRYRSLLFKALGNIVFTKNNQDFTVPNSVVKVGVEVGSNPALLPSENTPEDQIVYEYFKSGAEPTEVSAKYQKLQTPQNFTATYNEQNKTVSLRWSAIPTPAGNSSYGSFGYNVYFNNTLLGFTSETSYSFETSAPDGTYRVVATFQNYTSNQSDAATATIQTRQDPSEDEEEEEENTDYTAYLIGDKFNEIKVGGTYTDPNPPIQVIENSTEKDITDEVIDGGGLSITITDSEGTKYNQIDTNKVTVYSITYRINYKGFQKSFVRTVSVTN